MKAPLRSEEEIFSHALALPAAERPAYLDQSCGQDVSLRQRSEALLRAHDAAGNLLDVAPGGAVRTALFRPPPDETPGTAIGRYRLLQKIGEGGCGAVYLAEQRSPVVRRVALKVIKLGMDTKEVIGRFEVERQALALMDHPNIARVLDAGATDTGRPYFVMELVRGRKITDYCDQHHLTLDARLHLFIQVCHAVQHAHQKGIIHRDIKPSNILVTREDGGPRPKVIDFGIAKATQGRLTDQTFFTAFEQLIGTPAYMSPEQAEMSNGDIDTRSDIYSLGVLLYELLTGRTPFENQALLKAGLDEMRRQIREVEPPRPSTRLQLLGAGVMLTIARHRGTVPAKLLQLVRGDLDWIVMRCLEKDRRRRYETASRLAQDVENLLADEPVMAAAPSLGYQLQKLTKRHRTLVFTAIGFVFALTAAASVSTVLAFRASRLEQAASAAKIQADTAARAARHEADTRLAVEDFLRVHLLSGGTGAKDETTLCDRLDRAAAELRVRPPANPLTEIAIRENLAAGYRSLGLRTSLQEQLSRILELYRAQRGDADHQTVQASQNLQQALSIWEDRSENPPAPAPAVSETSPAPTPAPVKPLPLPVVAAAEPPVAGPAPPASADLLQPLVISLGTLLPRGTTQERLLLRLAESWRVASNGKISLRVFSDGRVGNESEMLRLLHLHRLQAACLTAIGLEEIDSGAVGLQKLPMAFASLAELDYVTERLTPVLEERLKQKGLVVLFWSDGGWIQLFSRQPVETPADLMALRLFMWAGRPAHVKLMRSAGFNPVPLESGDYLPALRSGLIDAGALPPFLALAYQIDLFAPHLLVLNSEPLIGACVIRRDTWESIPAETRERLLAISRATGREITASARRESEAAVTLMQKRGLTVHTIPPTTTEEWHRIAEKLRPLTRGNIIDADIFDRVLALLAEYRALPPDGPVP